MEQPDEEIYFKISIGDASFIILNSEMPEKLGLIADTQFEFLNKTLPNLSTKYNFVFAHRPFYNINGIGRHHKDSFGKYPEHRDMLWALFKNANIISVFVGHEHFYNRSNFEGITQFITGGGGAPLYADFRSGGFYHFVLIDKVEERTLKYKTIALKEDQKTFFTADEGFLNVPK